MRHATWLLPMCLTLPLVCMAQPLAEDNAKPVMRWLVTDYPPAFILVNNQPTDGFFDRMLRSLSEAWPEVTHRYEVTNPSRGLRTVTDGEQACYVGALQTPERERLALLIPTHLIYPMHVIVAHEAWGKVPKNANGEVQLSKLLEKAELRGVLVRGRSYSAEIDAAIAAHPTLDHVQYVSRSEGGSNVLRMMTQARADYTLEYPTVLTYQRQQNPAYFEGRALTVHAIEGGKPLLAGILCPRNPWGSRTAQHLDVLIAKLARDKSYATDATRWIPAESAPHYQKDIANFFRLRTRPYPTSRYELGPP